MSNDLRFVGLTKQQFVGVLVSLAISVLMVQVWLVVQNRNLAQQGAQSHRSLCVLKADYGKRLADSEAFLKLTDKQRARRYGPSLGSIPDSAIQQTIRGLRANIASLSDLHC